MLDISFLVEDPDFTAPTFNVIRTSQVLTQGVVSLVTTQYNDVIGIVISRGTKDLTRVTDGEYSKGNRAITVYTKFPLSSGGDGDLNNDNLYTADIIEFRNTKYTVVNVSDWSHAGFFKAVCDLLPVNPTVVTP